MAKIKNNRKGVWSVGAYVVLPGETGIIPDADWAVLRKGVVVASMIEAGDLTEVGPAEEEHKKGKKS